MRRVSLSWRLLWSVGGSTVAVAALASVMGFFLFLKELEANKAEFMAEYVAERATLESDPFNDMSGFHASAVDAMKERLRSLATTPDAIVEERFDGLFPLRPDGTRRSRPEYFDGVTDPRLGRISGMGAFISGREPLTLEDKRLMLAAFAVVHGIGTAQKARHDNFYFYTPSDRLVMFGPNRPDRLLHYRERAPADFSVRGEEMLQMTLPRLNPSREMRCTRLRFLLSDASQSRQSTACATPVDLNGRHVGAFGSSVFVTDMLTDTMDRRLEGAENLMVEAGGGLIAYPGFAKPGEAPRSVVERLEQELGLRGLMRRVAADPDHTGVIDTADGRHLVAYARLDRPGWYLLMRYPKSELAMAAARSAGFILVIGLLAAVLQAILVVRLNQRQVVRPLRELALEALNRRGSDEALAAAGRRPDEIGRLARALRRERSKVDRLLASLEARVRQRTAELEAANAAKSRFLANMSHELRTPLNGVIAIADLLQGSVKDPADRDKAALIASSGKHLERVVGDILDFSKLEAGQVRLEAVPFDLVETLEAVSGVHRAAAEAKGLGLTLVISPSARGWRLGDPTRTSQIMSNLLSNAVKFTEAGGVTVRVDGDAEGVAIEVQDSGPGFSREVAERLFQPFEQADASVTRKYGGAGLGLAISAALAREMGGGIEADGSSRNGACFTLRLPLPRVSRKPQSAAGEPEAAPDNTADALASAAPPRILLAEDHPANRKVVELILGSAGHDLTMVEDGAAAVEAHAAAPYDLILMDMMMPVMDGLTATRRIRETDAHTPILMLTANALDEHVRAAHEAGADRHLSKPVRPAELLAAIDTALAERARLAA